MRNFIRFITRPFVGDQNTGREAYLRYQGLAPAAYNGNGGFTPVRSMRATTPANITPGPTHKLNDPSVTGNSSAPYNQQPLSDNSPSIASI